MPRRNRQLNEVILPADVNGWDKAYDRAPVPIDAGGTGAAITAADPDNETLRDMRTIALRLSADLVTGATFNFNNAGPLPIYTALDTPATAGLKAGAIVGLTYNDINKRWYITGAGGGGPRAAATTTGAAAALEVALPGFELSDMAALSIKLHTAVDGTPTLSVNGFAPAPIVDASGEGHVKAVANTVIDLVYNGTAFVMQGISYGNLNNWLTDMSIDGGSFEEEAAAVWFDGGLF